VPQIVGQSLILTQVVNHRKMLRNLEESGLKQLATLRLTHISLSLGKSIPALKYSRWSTTAFCFGSCGYKESSDA
jgi:hypothetical protein